jgi:hypothetical protein
MVDHIYGRKDILTRKERAHMFVREAELYLDVFEGDLELLGTSLATKSTAQISASLGTFANGLEFYRSLEPKLAPEEQDSFSRGLGQLSDRLAQLRLRLTESAMVCA